MAKGVLERARRRRIVERLRRLARRAAARGEEAARLGRRAARRLRSPEVLRWASASFVGVGCVLLMSLAWPRAQAGFAEIPIAAFEADLERGALRTEDIHAARRAFERIRAFDPSAPRSFAEARIELEIARRFGLETPLGRGAALRAEAALRHGLAIEPFDGRAWANVAHLAWWRTRAGSNAEADRLASIALAASIAVAPREPSLIARRSHLAFWRWDRLDPSVRGAFDGQFRLAMERREARRALARLAARFEQTETVLAALAPDRRPIFLEARRAALESAERASIEDALRAEPAAGGDPR